MPTKRGGGLVTYLDLTQTPIFPVDEAKAELLVLGYGAPHQFASLHRKQPWEKSPEQPVAIILLSLR